MHKASQCIVSICVVISGFNNFYGTVAGSISQHNSEGQLCLKLVRGGWRKCVRNEIGILHIKHKFLIVILCRDIPYYRQVNPD